MYSFEEQPVDSEYVTEQAMNAIYDLVIEPMEDKLTEEDATLIGVIGMALKVVANKAKAYEDIMQGKGDFSKHSRN